MQKVFIIGRQPDPSNLTREEIPLIINESPETAHVSRTHARLSLDQYGNFHIEDLGSTGGTYVNGARISHITKVHPHSRVTLGKQYAFDFNHPTILQHKVIQPQDLVHEPEVVTDSIQYAGWGQRFLAYIVDWIFLAIVGALILQFSRGNLIIANSLMIITTLIYFGSTLSKSGQTLGKKMVGIKVLSLSTMQPPSYMQAIGRYFGYYLSVIPIMIGFLAPLWTEKKQAFHDSVANTIVVKA